MTHTDISVSWWPYLGQLCAIHTSYKWAVKIWELVLYLGQISINRRWTVGRRDGATVGRQIGCRSNNSATSSTFEKKGMKRGDEEDEVALTTLPPHQLYKPFFSWGERYKMTGHPFHNLKIIFSFYLVCVMIWIYVSLCSSMCLPEAC